MTVTSFEKILVIVMRRRKAIKLVLIGNKLFWALFIAYLKKTKKYNFECNEQT